MEQEKLNSLEKIIDLDAYINIPFNLNVNSIYGRGWF